MIYYVDEITREGNRQIDQFEKNYRIVKDDHLVLSAEGKIRHYRVELVRIYPDTDTADVVVRWLNDE